MYRPTPDSVTVKDSPIDGRGLFATQDIPEWTKLGISHILVEGNPTGDDLVRLPLGGFYNHSNEPNCDSVRVRKSDGTISHWELWTNRLIKEGEELTIRYTTYIPNK